MTIHQLGKNVVFDHHLRLWIEERPSQSNASHTQMVVCVSPARPCLGSSAVSSLWGVLPPFLCLQAQVIRRRWLLGILVAASITNADVATDESNMKYHSIIVWHRWLHRQRRCITRRMKLLQCLVAIVHIRRLPPWIGRWCRSIGIRVMKWRK